jgi:hypothetical protein
VTHASSHTDRDLNLRRLSPVDVEGERRKPWQRCSQPTAIAAVAG